MGGSGEESPGGIEIPGDSAIGDIKSILGVQVFEVFEGFGVVS